jgi:methanethiol S-methyltransferase
MSTPRSHSPSTRVLALLYGVTTHLVFLASVASISFALHEGMHGGVGRLTGAAAVVVDLLLLFQFPILHSLLLTARGRRALGRGSAGRDLSTTTYVLVSSVQLLLVAWCWSPIAPWAFRTGGGWFVLNEILYVGSWLLLGKAILDSGPSVQMGWLGWTSVVRNRAPRFPGLATGGLCSVSRQPVYLGFSLMMWTAPTWTLDRMLLAVVWTVYCLLAPLHKEARYRHWYGAAFEEYSRRVPYFFAVPGRRERTEPSGGAGLPTAS